MQPGTQAYIPWFKELFIFEFIGNTLMFFVSIYIIYLFFNKKSTFPKVFIGLIIFQLVFVVTDAYAVGAMLPYQDIQFMSGDITRRALAPLIWIPYMMLSERVKTTFVK